MNTASLGIINIIIIVLIGSNNEHCSLRIINIIVIVTNNNEHCSLGIINIIVIVIVASNNEHFFSRYNIILILFREYIYKEHQNILKAYIYILLLTI